MTHCIEDSIKLTKVVSDDRYLRARSLEQEAGNHQIEKRGQMNVCLVCHPGRGSRTLSRFPIGSLSESGAFSRPIT